MVDILFLAKNRLAFTRESLAAMQLNTNWSRVRSLVIWDDGSTDGTREWMKQWNVSGGFKVPVKYVESNFGSPVAVMNAYVRGGDWTNPNPRPCEIFAKIDNDVVLPPNWLNNCLQAMTPEIDILGIEPLNGFSDPGPKGYGAAMAEHIGGIGLMRRKCFDRALPVAAGRMGFTAWQIAEQQSDLKKAWIQPGIPVVLLNRVNAEPWKSLSESYVAQGWQRTFPGYYTAEEEAALTRIWKGGK